MSRTAVTIFVALIVGAGLTLFVPDPPPRPSMDRACVACAQGQAPVVPEEATDATPREPSAELMSAADLPAPARQPVPVEVEPDPELTARVAELTDERDALARRVESLQEENDLLALELRRRDINPETPFGAFLMSPEAQDLAGEPEVIDQIGYVLDDFPLVLRPGEATWLAERIRNKDWKHYATTRTAATLAFLGPDRVLAELEGTQALADMREFYDEDEWRAMTGR